MADTTRWQMNQFRFHPIVTEDRREYIYTARVIDLSGNQDNHLAGFTLLSWLQSTRNWYVGGGGLADPEAILRSIDMQNTVDGDRVAFDVTARFSANGGYAYPAQFQQQFEYFAVTKNKKTGLAYKVKIDLESNIPGLEIPVKNEPTDSKPSELIQNAVKENIPNDIQLEDARILISFKVAYEEKSFSPKTAAQYLGSSNFNSIDVGGVTVPSGFGKITRIEPKRTAYIDANSTFQKSWIVRYDVEVGNESNIIVRPHLATRQLPAGETAYSGFTDLTGSGNEIAATAPRMIDDTGVEVTGGSKYVIGVQNNRFLDWSTLNFNPKPPISSPSANTGEA